MSRHLIVCQDTRGARCVIEVRHSRDGVVIVWPEGATVVLTDDAASELRAALLEPAAHRVA